MGGDRLAAALCSGDIDGDGHVDLIVVADGPDGQIYEGQLKIVWGTALQDSGFIDTADPGAQLAWVLGKSSDYPFFAQLACGDFNDDGADDIIYTQPFGQIGPNTSGMAYVIFGSTTFPDTLDLQDGPPSVITIFGAPYGGSLGRGVCAADLNGDGYDDMILSAPSLDPSEIYVIWGGESFASLYDLDQANVGMTRIIDSGIDNVTGESLAAGDLDKDGYDDLVIGSIGAFGASGMVTVLYGKSVFPDTLALFDPTFQTKKIRGEAYADGRLGARVAVGDTDGNGSLDLILSAPYADPLGCSNCGEVYVLYDADQLPDSCEVGSSLLPISRLIGESDFMNYGLNLLSSDLDGNGCDDIVVVSPGEDSSPSKRAVSVVVYGQTGHTDTIFIETDSTVTRIRAEFFGDDLGGGISSADFDGDGVADLALGADRAEPLGRPNAGMAYIWWGVKDEHTNANGSGPPAFAVRQNQPNPFSSATTIAYSLSTDGRASLTVYNALGQRVAEISVPSVPGSGTVTWDGRDETGRRLPSGVYFYRLQAGGFWATKKMVLIR